MKKNVEHNRDRDAEPTWLDRICALWDIPRVNRPAAVQVVGPVSTDIYTRAQLARRRAKTRNRTDWPY